MKKLSIVFMLTVLVAAGCATSKTSSKDYTLSNKACAEIRSENYDEAKKLLEEALEINPKNAFAWLNLGVVNQKQENYDKAKECYLKVVDYAWDEKGSNKAAEGRSLVKMARENLELIPANY